MERMDPTNLYEVVETTRAALVDVDRSYFFQILLFIGTAVTLNQLVFKPLLKVEDLRHAKTQGAIEEAQRLEKNAQEQIARYETFVGEARKKGMAELATLREGAQHKAQERQAEARSKADAQLADSMKRLGQRYETARKDMTARADQLSALIVEKVLGS
jgi:F-type H+-transporting ATPase subunit b